MSQVPNQEHDPEDDEHEDQQVEHRQCHGFSFQQRAALIRANVVAWNRAMFVAC